MINQFTTLTSTAIPLKIENVDTDQIIPARFLKATTREGFGKQLFFDWRYDAQGNPKTDFVLNSPDYTGEILIAGKNFGCGSSREIAPIIIKLAGVGAVLSKSFGRIFYRNAINIGLPILECEQASDAIQNGDRVEVDFDTGVIRNLTREESYTAAPFPAFIKEIIDADGLLNSIRRRMGK